jgi:hypothetical protein
MIMNGQKALGHILLWTGFLAAALATVSQKELDLLPKTEQEILEKLDDGLSIAKAELLKLTGKPIGDMTEAELGEAVGWINAWNADHLRQVNELKEKGEPALKQTHPKTKIDLITMRTARLANLWSTVRWSWYALAMLVAFGGVFVLRASNRTADLINENFHGQYSMLSSAIFELVEKLQTLDTNFDNMIPEEIVDFIDDQCVVHFNDFADSRNTITQRYGLTAFAEIMSEFATGERYINRAWSASADGYVDEAKSSVKRSLSHLVEAKRLLEKYAG